MIAGGVLGPIERPLVLVAGLYQGDRVIVGRTPPLNAAQSSELAAILQPVNLAIRGRMRSRRSGGAPGLEEAADQGEVSSFLAERGFPTSECVPVS
jgi:hypothetical protein